MRVLHVEVREEDDLEPVAHNRIGVYDFSHSVNEFDNALGQEITRRRFAAEEKRARGHICLWMASQSQIQRDDVQRGEMLPFVFVDALYQHIDERESRQPGVVRREFFAYFIEKTAINLVHDFEMPREQ